MKQSLQLKIGQHLAMTPQLQQAIKLLQLSSIELQTEIQEALESNPMLEADEPQPNISNEDSQNNDSLTADKDLHETTQNEQIPDDLPVDAAWEDTYQNTSQISSGGSGLSEEEERTLIERNSQPDTLIDHLIWQLELTPMSAIDHAIGITIIESLEENGFLTASLDDLRTAVLKETHLFPEDISEEDISENENTIDDEEIIAVLHRIQQFDPPGIAARHLQECLNIQIDQFPPSLPWQIEAKRIIEDYIEPLSKHDYALLQRKLELDDEELQMVLKLIQSLNPCPGSRFQADKTQYVIPDVIVRKHQGTWRVELNTDAFPRLRINNNYANLAKKNQSQQDSQYLKEHLQEARWFLKSLQSRNETLLKVASKIVEHQKGFFEYGEQAMKPMVLNDIALAVEMHESTISRVTTQKYILTPKGIFELKYFFSSRVNTTTGGECSSIAIKALIKKLISQEDKKKPYSDQKIAEILTKEKGINAARRTVAKYREALNIESSSKRKRLMDL